MDDYIVVKTDFPDPDVIRVEDTYYMISTTMHFMPGGVILRSYDLLNWEIISYVYDTLEDTDRHRLEENKNIYGEGMWAGCLRYHNGLFYVCFTANDTQKTYLFTSSNIEGPWQKKIMEGFYHDNSILFDDDGKVYIVYGNTEIYLTELDSELNGPKKDGVHRIIIKDEGDVRLGYEGAHIYKMNGKYYIFLIHWPDTGHGRRTQACFVADSLTDEFIGKDILDEDMGYFNQGVAQGGIVDTPEGDWYAMLFQDRGAVGRIPVIVPIRWKDKFPVLNFKKEKPEEIRIKSTHLNHIYEPVVANDDFQYATKQGMPVTLKKQWQWNHNPNSKLWTVEDEPGKLIIKTNKISKNVTQAVNCLTQRMMFPNCDIKVTLDGSNLKDGDYAGLCALQGKYSLIALTKENGHYYLVQMVKKGSASKMGQVCDEEPGVVTEKVRIHRCQVSLRIIGDFMNMKDHIQCFYEKDGKWVQLGETTKHYFTLDHFTGCRIGLFIYSTEDIGGKVAFTEFKYHC